MSCTHPHLPCACGVPRETREAAVENWGIALSFWEVHLNVVHPPSPTPCPPLFRETREAAVENWGIALSFWEVHLAQRCLMRWAGHKLRVLATVTQRWTANSLRSSFRSDRQDD